MKRTRHVSSAFKLRAFGVCLAIAFFTTGLANSDSSLERVTKTLDTKLETEWLIEPPEVTTARKQYDTEPKRIEFKKGDEVTVTGGGCIDTGSSLPLWKWLRLAKTWKRYVDPSGSNSDRLYHGRILIPGATDGLVRISSIEKQTLVVNKFPDHYDDSPLFLQLGYEDDNHKDNSYLSKHDNGNGDQCKSDQVVELPDGRKITDGAWIKIHVVHHDDPATALPSPTPRAPLDLWWDKVDENFLPWNPDWWVHHNENRIPNSSDRDGCDGFREGPHDKLIMGHSPKCTMWDPDVDEANSKSRFCHVDNPPLLPKSNRVHGHVNWGAVTYKGSIYFDVANNGPHFVHGQTKLCKGASIIGDADYDWLLVTDGERGISEGNVADSLQAYPGPSLKQRGSLPAGKKALALEFSSRETVDLIRSVDCNCKHWPNCPADCKNRDPWWNAFHYDVDFDCETARKSVYGKEAIVIGLMGFDNEHEKKEKKESASEVLQRLGTGARVELHPVWGLAINVSEKDSEDRWVIFARNWGDEGSCSNGWSITHSKWQHWLPLPGNKMKFFLPGSPSPSEVVPNFYHGCYDSTTKCDAPRMLPAQVFPNGVLVTLQLAAPEDKSFLWGEVRIPKKKGVS